MTCTNNSNLHALAKDAAVDTTVGLLGCLCQSSLCSDDGAASSCRAVALAAAPSAWPCWVSHAPSRRSPAATGTAAPVLASLSCRCSAVRSAVTAAITGAAAPRCVVALSRPSTSLSAIASRASVGSCFSADLRCQVASSLHVGSRSAGVVRANELGREGRAGNSVASHTRPAMLLEQRVSQTEPVSDPPGQLPPNGERRWPGAPNTATRVGTDV